MRIKYEDLTKRNIGIFTKSEQKKLSKSTVAIAGVGGIGGLAAERLVRMGVGKVKIADPEDFEPSNLNRQYGSGTRTIGQNKAKVVEKQLKEINPSVKVEVFPEGFTKNNAEKFLKSADIIIDGVDISVPFSIRTLIYQIAKKNKKYIISANAIGFGAVLYVFSPQGMSLEEFFLADKAKPHFMPIDRMCPMPPDYVPKSVTKKIMQGKQDYMPTISIGVGLASLWMAEEVVNILLKKKAPIVVPKCTALDLLNRSIKVFSF